MIFYYSDVLWEAVGFDESQSFLITVITSIVNILTTLIAIALIDKIGRKPLRSSAPTGMAVTLATMAIIFGTAPQSGGIPQLGGCQRSGGAGRRESVRGRVRHVVGPGRVVLLGEMFPHPDPRRCPGVWRPPVSGLQIA